jgi:undecaprenyl-diphosphatase
VRVGPLVVAAVLAAFLAWRWRRVAVENRVLGAVAAAALAIYGAGLVDPPNLEHLIRDVGSTLGPYTYLLVGVMAFLETGAFVGLIAPGETVVILGGFVAGQGEIDIVVLIGLVWAAAVAGDSASFLLGRRLGRDFLVRHGRRVRITEERLDQVERFLARHGGPTIVIGRYVGLVRALAPFVAGASRLPFARFIPYDIVAAGTWAAVFSLLGFVFWRSFDTVLDAAKKGAFAFATVIGLVVAAVALYRYLRVPANRARARAFLLEQAERPALRPLARVALPVYRRGARPAWRRVAPGVRFAWDRLTPGQLGLELTTLLAIVLVGGFLFGALGSLVEGHASLATDRTAFDVAGGLRERTLTNVAEIVTDLGAVVVVGIVVGLAAGYLVVRRRPLEWATLVAGSLLSVLAVDVSKAGFDRARPSGGLVEVEGESFPSGHATYSIVYVAVAVAVTRTAGYVYSAAAVVAAIVLAAAIGLTRVYLRAHYLSDVVAGWGLGAAAFALCGLVAVVVAYLRKNGSPQR